MIVEKAIIGKSKELRKKYGSLAGDVANEVLNAIPIQAFQNREIWMNIKEELTPKTKENDSKGDK